MRHLLTARGVRAVQAPAGDGGELPLGPAPSPVKKAAQASPYRYLLKPKAGGVAFVLAAPLERKWSGACGI
jgi:hypothetical protein